jgi:hypothetical protein
MGPLLCSRSFRFFLIVVWLCFADVVLAQDQSASDAGQPALTYPYNQPWGPVEKKSSKAKAQQAPTFQELPKNEPANPPAQPPAAVETVVPAAPVAQPGDMPVLPVPSLSKPVVAKNEVSAAGDFFYGSGTVTIPIGYSLQKTLQGGGIGSFQPTAQSVDRSSEYVGGTISYSYLHAWFIDVSYDHGTSSGNSSLGAKFLGNLPTTFTIKDDWYQAYLRYAFPRLRGKRFTAYLRAGASYVQADLREDSKAPFKKNYQQQDRTDDILGNVGFGVGYSLYATRRFKISLQGEGEGFYGSRSQDTKETLSADAGLTAVSDQINNDLYGGIGRGTVRFEYRVGRADRFRLFVDGGVQGKFTEITYPSSGKPATGGGTFSELLWGPYAKLGLSYSF